MEASSPSALDTIKLLATSVSVLRTEPESQISKQAIRTSLKASTLDGVFAAIFSSITSGVLLTNFLLGLGASPVEIGMMSSIPMVVNLLQPLGAYFADRTTSRRIYSLGIFLPARLLWLILVLGIGWSSWSTNDPHRLAVWTLAMVFASNILGAFGTASWFSWMTTLVPHRLRGRYFGFRNSAASLTTLIGVPLLGFAVSAWPSGTVQGYGVVLFLGVVAGLVSLGCQFFRMTDVNPQHPIAAALSRSGASRQEMGSRGDGEQGRWGAGEMESKGAGERIDIGSQEPLCPLRAPQRGSHSASPASLPTLNILKDSNFLRFLLYFGIWMFAFNLSAPFFNLYLLDNLHLDLGRVTLYTSLTSGANLIMLVLWGKLADRVGNRPLLLSVGILVAVTPLLWLGVGTDQVSLWVWLPLIHLLTGGTLAAVDLCNNNIQMEVAPNEHPSTYFAIAAAVAGVGGALGTTAGGFLAGLTGFGGLPGLFALSTIVRLVALLPLVFVREPRSQRLAHLVANFLRLPRLLPVQAPSNLAQTIR